MSKAAQSKMQFPELSDEPVQGGLYQHFKGGFYLVVDGSCIDSSNGDLTIAYMSLQEKDRGQVYLRSKKAWFDPSPQQGPGQKRYRRLVLSSHTDGAVTIE